VRDYPETERDIVIVIAGIPIVDVGQTAVVGVTTDQTVTVSKLLRFISYKLTVLRFLSVLYFIRPPKIVIWGGN